jgi:hypothetical protein
MTDEPRNPDSKTCAVWATPDQAPLASACLRRAGLTAAWAASPGRAGPHALAEALGCETAETFRSLVRADARCALLLAPAPSDPDAGLHDPSLLRRLRERETRILSVEPTPASVRDAAALGASDLDAVVHIGPLLRRSPGGSAALDAMETFGHVRVIALTAISRPGQGSLAARLIDAMDWMLAALGEPETVDACVHGPRSSAGLTLAPGESLATLTGEMTAHLRFATGASATLTLSDRSGRWFRGATMHGDAGVLRVVDGGLEWLDDAGAPSERTDADAPPPTGAEAIGDALREAVEGRPASVRPFDFLRTLAMAEAAVLSARTGQAESPATLLRMAGAA